MKLIKICEYKGSIVLKSGLHIGSGNMEMHIGGTDSPVIMHPHTREPYIPGSSIKGKARSLLEMESGFMAFTKGSPLSPKALQQAVDSAMEAKGMAIIKFFGAGGSEQDDSGTFGPTRVSFADCYLNGAWKEKAKANRWPLTEVKSENSINRVTGTAQNPRFIERVPEGTEFDFTVSFKVLHEGEEELFEGLLFKGLKLIEMDALGGSGSRGYGRVEFIFADTGVQERFTVCNPF
ncbi:MAG TPA: type III-A CRISPR-associated RAMP protein Csm3 [Desulfuromonadales bacterium]|nr:type III-A CRISPR-associated RAMP protein Csm3 [Desulfuromonadales bacterium]